MTTQDDEKRQLQRTVQELVREFGGRLSEDEVQRRFAEVVQAFDGAPVRSFVPVLASRAVRRQLRELSSS